MPNYTNKELLVKFGEMIKTARLEAGLRQTELAQALDIQQGTISEIEKGRTNINLNLALALMEKLNLMVVQEGVDHSNIPDDLQIPDVDDLIPAPLPRMRSE